MVLLFQQCGPLVALGEKYGKMDARVPVRLVLDGQGKVTAAEVLDGKQPRDLRDELEKLLGSLKLPRASSAGWCRIEVDFKKAKELGDFVDKLRKPENTQPFEMIPSPPHRAR